MSIAVISTSLSTCESVRTRPCCNRRAPSSSTGVSGDTPRTSAASLLTVVFILKAQVKTVHSLVRGCNTGSSSENPLLPAEYLDVSVKQFAVALPATSSRLTAPMGVSKVSMSPPSWNYARLDWLGIKSISFRLDYARPQAQVK